VSHKAFTTLIFVVAFLAPALSADESDQLPTTFLTKMTPMYYPGASIAAGGTLGKRSNGSLLGIDSIPNWSSYFYFPGVDSFGGPQYTWSDTMVGKSPLSKKSDGGNTEIPAPIIPVTLDLRNADGSPRFVNGKPLISRPDAFIKPTLGSPVFQNASYDSTEKPTQFTDALMQAEFPQHDEEATHTLLDSVVKTGRTLILKRGTYRYSLNPDGTCCAYVLVDIGTFVNGLFPSGPGDTSTVMGQSEAVHDVKTSDISTFLFPNTFLYFNNNPNQCCVIGFHSYDVEPGDQANGYRERRYVMNFSSWITPGTFRDPNFADVAALSHEMAELFNDPFVNNATPWWLSPNGNCQNNLETGDVTEGLPNAIYPIALKGVTYHVQNEALLQWFAGQTPSSAIDRAYSYPNKNVLTSASVSRGYGCQ
jgi:hypothetical protein